MWIGFSQKHGRIFSEGVYRRLFGIIIVLRLGVVSFDDMARWDAAVQVLGVDHWRAANLDETRGVTVTLRHMPA